MQIQRTKTKSQIYNISSKNATNGSYKSNISCSLPDLNFSNANIKNVYLSVLHCEVPNSFYVINYTNNTIVVNDIIYTMPLGNYNANTFITALLALLPSGYTIIYSTITNRYTITHTTTEFTINASNSSCTINNVIGLGSTDVTSTSLTLTLPYNVNFLPIPRINFRSNLFRFNNYNQADNSSNIFLSLQNNAPVQGVIQYQNNSLIKYLIEDKTLTSFDITVTDDIGNLLNLNNVDWYLTFQLDIEFLDTSTGVSFGQIISNNYSQF